MGVRWQLPDGRWVQVLSFGPRSEAQVLRHSVGGYLCFAAQPPADNRATNVVD